MGFGNKRFEKTQMGLNEVIFRVAKKCNANWLLIWIANLTFRTKMKEKKN